MTSWATSFLFTPFPLTKLPISFQDRVTLGIYRHNDFTTTTNTPAEQALLDDLANMLDVVAARLDEENAAAPTRPSSPQPAPPTPGNPQPTPPPAPIEVMVTQETTVTWEPAPLLHVDVLQWIHDDELANGVDREHSPFEDL